MKKLLLVGVCLTLFNCKNNGQPTEMKEEPVTTEVSSENTFNWDAATIYFLLTDRFNNADKTNDVNFDRTKPTGKLRGFMGGDIKGITQKIEEGYFNDLGANAIWFTPVVEQIHDSVDEGTGNTYAFHGYWAKDWTSLDPNFGTDEDLHTLVETAHKNGIRVLMDAVINHTGPVTDKDPAWEDSWVRTGPQCEYSNYENTITCTLVANLPDVKTESNENVGLPAELEKKWKAEGRYEQEMAELDAYFEKTGHPRAPRFYIMKWLTDFITDHGIDGFRVDTVKHTEEFVWDEFKKDCEVAFAAWKKSNPDRVLDDSPFYTVGEVYNYGISGGRNFDFGDRKVDYFDNGFNSLINFDFKHHAKGDYESLFSNYSDQLQTTKGLSVLNYLSSHDDGAPFDKKRERPYETGTKLLLSPGSAQIYYGDETARSLAIEGTVGDATLRSFMNWDAIENDTDTQKVLTHWQKLGQFRAKHPSVGGGTHEQLSPSPYVFKRSLGDDNVVIALDLPEGEKAVDVSAVFADGTQVKDHYSGTAATVSGGKVTIDSSFGILLLEQVN